MSYLRDIILCFWSVWLLSLSHKDVFYKSRHCCSVPGYYSSLICCASKSPGVSSALKYYHVRADVAHRAALRSHQVDLAVPAQLLSPGLDSTGRHNKKIGAKRWLHMQGSWQWRFCLKWTSLVRRQRYTVCQNRHFTKHHQRTHDTLMCVLYTAKSDSSVCKTVRFTLWWTVWPVSVETDLFFHYTHAQLPA